MTLQGRVHLDRRHRADALACGRRPRSSRTARSCRSGASTARAPTRRRASNSDCVLQPVASYPDPIRGGDDVLVMCEVLLPDMTPHVTNTRALLRPVAEKFADQEPLFGIEQEYTFFKDGRPLGFPPNGFPAPQAFYYCGVGADEVFGRDVVEAHLEACLDAGLGISGINAEVMPGQWEFQVGPARPARRVRPAVGRPLAALPRSPRTSASPPRSTRSRSRATGTAPVRTPTSRPTRCARATTRSSPRARRSAPRPRSTSPAYGADIEHRLTGSHETAPWSRVQLRRVRPRRVGAHPVAGRDRQEGLHRGPASERQHGPVRRDPADHRHGLQRARRRRLDDAASTRHEARFAARISWSVRRAFVVPA